MRNEKEIRDRIRELQKSVKRETRNINEMISNNETDFLDLAMTRGNMYKSEICHLMWVLGEID